MSRSLCKTTHYAWITTKNIQILYQRRRMIFSLLLAPLQFSDIFEWFFKSDRDGAAFNLFFLSSAWNYKLIRCPKIFTDNSHLKGFLGKHRNIYNVYKRKVEQNFASYAAWKNTLKNCSKNFQCFSKTNLFLQAM